MENDTNKLIKEQLKTLPQNLQRAIAAVPWKTLVEQIGKENGLSTEQIESLERETMFIIYAFEPAEDYIANIIREINISEEAAGTIAQSVAEKILDYISKQAEEFGNEVIKEETPAIAADIHPMIEPGEVAHTVDSKQQIVDSGKPIQEPPKVSVPDYRYGKGKDPYREPLA
ncbi:MAG: hypothetical protein A2832_01355 [Candidatus Zambryskibacteria bacterium RIFCSPHIGHO2_01_FULL_44_22b]|uniref:Uncharacterized protein n=2 Tax=Candidatus Zambryskiibacteriota TaxID=1817925 RepID=A0A1G2T189_9BACT|nr:MAG: hypothetical protein A2832_01355 [Candidatus Zambryskibacteria bacterium RIFCSPHIGHO2_01_FULL_44_22b]OHB05811.1 MAG: hypothetical protein A3B16_00455 [Candidatus Zambryskibacteria bacterium RIFCSPLOWO2_01_FULL_45_43]